MGCVAADDRCCGLAGQIPREQTHTGDADYFTRLKVETRFGQRVASIDPAAKTIKTTSDEELVYDNLLIATGARPLDLPVDGGDLPGVTPKWSLAHIEKGLEILERQPHPRVALVALAFYRTWTGYCGASHATYER